MSTLAIALAIVAVILSIVLYVIGQKKFNSRMSYYQSEDWKNLCKGNDGKQGATGPKGDRGPQGEKGEKGKDGRDGINGKDGKDGKDGVIIKGTITGEKIISLLSKEENINLSNSNLTAKTFLQAED